MYETRQPITNANLKAEAARAANAILSGTSPAQAKPYSGAIACDPVGEIAAFITETGSGTMEDLLLRFPSQLLTEKNIQAARDRANAGFVRRVA